MAGRTTRTEDAASVTDLERWAAAASFSHRGSLGPVETALWRAERHPALSGTNCIVIVLDQAPQWDRFLAAHEWGTSLVRRLRQRVLEPALPTTYPVWVDDAKFSLEHHVRRRTVGGAGELADALERAQRIALSPFDRARPLWQGTLLTGMADGSAVYVLKIHHALFDALGSVQLLSMLQSSTREHTADKPLTPRPPALSAAGAPVDAVSLATSGAVAELVAVPARAFTAARKGLYALREPGAAVSEGLRYAASVRRLVSPPPAPPSPLFTARGGRRWHFLALEAPLAELATAGHSVGASLQDAFVAAMLGGLRRYHEQHGVQVGDLPVSIRISLDRVDDPMSGNRFAGAMIAAPAGVEDPADRIAAVRGEVLSLHVEPALDAFRAAAPVAARLPSDLVAAVLAGGAVADMSVATNAGPTRTAYMAGAKVDAMYTFGPLPGVALSASLLSCVDTACVGINVDSDAVADLDVLQRCLREGLDEVLALTV